MHGHPQPALRAAPGDRQPDRPRPHHRDVGPGPPLPPVPPGPLSARQRPRAARRWPEPGRRPRRAPRPPPPRTPRRPAAPAPTRRSPRRSRSPARPQPRRPRDPRRADRVGQAGLGGGARGTVPRPGSWPRRRPPPGGVPGSRAVAPSTAAAPSTRRAAGTGRSSAPTWPPSAPTASATCSRSLTRHVAPYGAAERDHPPGQLVRLPVGGVVGDPDLDDQLGAGHRQGGPQHAERVPPGPGVGDQMQSSQGRHGNSPPCAGITRIRFDGRGLQPPSQPGAPGSRGSRALPYDSSADPPRGVTLIQACQSLPFAPLSPHKPEKRVDDTESLHAHALPETNPAALICSTDRHYSGARPRRGRHLIATDADLGGPAPIRPGTVCGAVVPMPPPLSSSDKKEHGVSPSRHRRARRGPLGAGLLALSLLASGLIGGTAAQAAPAAAALPQAAPAPAPAAAAPNRSRSWSSPRPPASATTPSRRASPRSSSSARPTASPSTPPRTRPRSPPPTWPSTRPWSGSPPPATCSTPTQQAAFERYIKAGGGFVGVHAASDTEYDWAVVRRAGRRLLRRATRPIQQATVKVEDHDAPVDRRPAGPVDPHRRVVQLPHQPARQVHVLATLDESVLQPGRRHDGRRPPDRLVPGLRRRPVLVHRLGHTQASYTEPDFRSPPARRHPVPRPGVDERRLRRLEDRELREGHARRQHAATRWSWTSPRTGGSSTSSATAGCRSWKPDTGARPSPAGTVPVFTGNENGLLGLAARPGLRHQQAGSTSSTRRAGGGPRNQLSRFKVNGDTLDLASEKIVLHLQAPSAASAATRPARCLRPATATSTSPPATTPTRSTPTASPRSTSGRPRSLGRAAHAGNTNDLNGKIMPDHSPRGPTARYTIPAGQPVRRPGTAKTRPEIYGMGFRNPFRFTVDPKTGWVLRGRLRPGRQHGQRRTAARRARSSGTSSRSAGNYGWPYCIRRQHAVQRLQLRDQAVAARSSTAPRRSTTRRTTPA